MYELLLRCKGDHVKSQSKAHLTRLNPNTGGCSPGWVGGGLPTAYTTVLAHNDQGHPRLQQPWKATTLQILPVLRKFASSWLEVGGADSLPVMEATRRAKAVSVS